MIAPFAAALLLASLSTIPVPEYAMCTRSSECVAVEYAGCSGGWEGVNKKYVQERLERARQINSAIECASSPPVIAKPKMTCKHGRCQPSVK